MTPKNCLRRSAVVLCVLWSLALAVPAFAQEALVLSVRRNFGYSNGSQIRGSFTLEAIGPADLTSVIFKIDDALVGAVNAPPFRIVFRTADYPVGWHALVAVGQTSDGRTLTSAPRRFEFATAEQEWAAVRRIIAGVSGTLGAILFVVLAYVLVLGLGGRGSKMRLPLGAPRRYGLLGGAVCPKCGRPFAIHGWGFNVGLRKFDRCDHCGKWSLVSRVSREELAQAEAAELKMAQPEAPVPEMSPEEKFKQQLDRTRFIDDL